MAGSAGWWHALFLNGPKAASESPRPKNILIHSEDPHALSDIVHTRASGTEDALEIAVIEEKLVRVLSRYDNEWSFSNRMVDTAATMARQG